MPSPAAPPWLVVSVALAMALLVSCSGCNERSPAQPPATTVSMDAQGPEPSSSLHSLDGRALEVGPAIDQPSVTHLLPLAGKVDVTNRYLSAVMVKAELDEETQLFCSGALIARHLVLTEGHCVCRRRTRSELDGSQTLIDSSDCAKAATVKTLVYKPGEGREKPPSSYGALHRGTVLPHPELRVLLDAQGMVVSSAADLALIHLDEPVDEEFKPISLADTDVQFHESIVIVGSGYDETANMHDEERRYSRNKITAHLPSGGGSMRIEQPEGHHYRADSGGPCLREGPQGITLVGIASRGLGEGQSITSTFTYRDWLRGELQRAKSPQPPTLPK